MQPPGDAPTPREPEIELLGRLAARAVRLLRRALWLAGATAIAYGLWRCGASGSWPLPSAKGFVWLCAGLPLVASASWLFGRGWRFALPALVLLWVVPGLLPDDHDYGYVLRIFASVAATLSLAVYTTLGRLADPPVGPPRGTADVSSRPPPAARC